MITPDSLYAKLIDDCLNNGYSFRIGARGVCIDCIFKGILEWEVKVPRAGMKTINCDTIAYDFEHNTLICGVEAGYVSSIEFDMSMYDIVKVIR